MPATRGARWAWMGLILAVVAADRALKSAIERATPLGFARVLIPHSANLVHSENAGIAFGMLGHSGSHAISLVLMVSAAVVVVLLAWMLLTGHAGGTLSETGVSLIAGGAAGNLLDRLLHGVVTDFLELHIGHYFYWPAFNLADSAIAVGAALVAWELLRDGRQSVTARR